jgi:hypothetical protein
MGIRQMWANQNRQRTDDQPRGSSFAAFYVKHQIKITDVFIAAAVGR